MQKIAVIIEMDAGGIKESVNAALSLGAQTGPVAALTTASLAEAQALVEPCSHFGVERIITISATKDLATSPEDRAAALAEYITSENITDVIAIHSMEGKDILARLAVILNAAFVGDCLAINLTSRTVKKSYFSGKAVATLTMPGGIALYGLRPNAIEATPIPSSPIVAEFQASTLPSEQAEQAKSAVTIIETSGEAAGTTDITEAAIIVSGGRAMGSAENFAVLRALASKLDAAVGASRAAVDAGYANHAMQIGQTGKTASPNLYIACGISGAVQHYAGIKTAKIIVAVNNDKDAPIFGKCDYGIVGDLFEVVPEIEKALGA